jgi:hypothetical protein
MMSADETQAAWSHAVGTDYYRNTRCECGASKVFKDAPNLEYLHSHWCPLYLDPNWLDKLKKEQKDAEDKVFG